MLTIYPYTFSDTLWRAEKPRVTSEGTQDNTRIDSVMQFGEFTRRDGTSRMSPAQRLAALVNV